MPAKHATTKRLCGSGPQRMNVSAAAAIVSMVVGLGTFVMTFYEFRIRMRDRPKRTETRT